MPEVTAADRQNAFLDKARKLYSDGKFKAALAAFKEASFQTCTEAMTNGPLTHTFKALLRCPCTRDVLVQSKKMGLSLKDIQISRCQCKDFGSLPTLNSPKLSMYKIAKRPCVCGSGVFHCNVTSHLNALDGIIATYEKLDAPVKARQYATLLIITSPRAPEGYLRLAKALRLSDAEQSPDTIMRCRWIYRQAIQSVQIYGNEDHPKLKIMADLLRMDILGSLPAELQNIILGSLRVPDLCRMMRVCKTWKRACLDPVLWKNLTFVRASGRSLRKGVFNKIISKRAQGKVKSLDLWGVAKLGIDLPTFKATLKVLNRLESLSLRGVIGPEDEKLDWSAAPPGDTWSRTVFEEAPPCLKTLHIGGLRSVYDPDPLSVAPVFPMAQSLEELRLHHMTTISTALGLLCSAVWPRLRKLTISTKSQREPLQIDLERILRATPSLKDLCFHNLRPFDTETSALPSWESLERLELILKVQTPRPSITLRDPLISLPRLHSAIRSLEFPDAAAGVLRCYRNTALNHPRMPTIHDPQMLQDPEIAQLITDLRFKPPVMELERLEHLYLRDTAFLFAPNVDGLDSLAWFMDLIKPSMSSGSLTSLAVTFCPEFRYELDRVLNKDAIRTLSCFDFLDEGSGSHSGDAFAHWVRGFHNLTTVGVYPQKSEGCWMHVSRLLAQESRIETIYTDVLTGQARDWVLAEAQVKGVKIIEASRIPEPALQPIEP